MATIAKRQDIGVRFGQRKSARRFGNLKHLAFSLQPGPADIDGILFGVFPVILVPLVLLIFWIGVYPKPFFERIEPAVKDVLVSVSRAMTVELDSAFQIKPVLAGDSIEAPIIAEDVDGDAQGGEQGE